MRREDQRIDMEQVERLAQEHKPKVIIAGGSGYPRHWDFAKFREIADSVGAIFFVDMAHFAGLVAGGVHRRRSRTPTSSPPTTHKTIARPARRHDPDQTTRRWPRS